MSADTVTSGHSAAEFNPEVADRLSQIDQALDPEHTLPEIEFLPESDRPQLGNLRPVPMLINYDGRTIGKCTIVSSDNRGKHRWFSGIRLEDDYRGRGFGLAAYKKAIEDSLKEGYTFRTHDYTQTDSARDVWERLSAAGVATVVVPFQRDDTEAKSVGHYEVRP